MPRHRLKNIINNWRRLWERRGRSYQNKNPEWWTGDQKPPSSRERDWSKSEPSCDGSKFENSAFVFEYSDFMKIDFVSPCPAPLRRRTKFTFARSTVCRVQTDIQFSTCIRIAPHHLQWTPGRLLWKALVSTCPLARAKARVVLKWAPGVTKDVRSRHVIQVRGHMG
jgi:hypothetical protein